MRKRPRMAQKALSAVFFRSFNWFSALKSLGFAVLFLYSEESSENGCKKSGRSHYNYLHTRLRNKILSSIKVYVGGGGIVNQLLIFDAAEL